MIYMMIVIIISLMSAGGQRHESYEGFISGIRANAVKGEVFYQRGDGKFNLEAGHKLEEGDFIKTENNSYAELLLQPGNYLRVGPDSELQIFSEPHDKMRLKLHRGAISIEVLARDGESSAYFFDPLSLSQLYELIRVITPSDEVFITRTGIFRINSPAAGRTELIVREGEAVINGRRVKEKRSGLASSQGVAISEINSKLEDNFDAWSRERADGLVRANRVLKHESLWANKRKEGEQTTVNLSDEEEETQSKSTRFVVSARPGAVNFVETGVEFSRPPKDWEPLTEKSHFETGDKLRTSAHTFTEVTMLPDISLRVDGESEILFEQLSNESISLKLLQGSAILDVARFERKEAPPIKLAGASTSVVIVEEGNYRIDSKPSGDEITIRNGKVMFKGRSVGSCRTIAGETVSDCDKKRSDNFDFWSDHRGEGQIFNRRGAVTMVTILDRIRRARFRNTGFWFQNPGTTHYTFVPFTSPRFRSPYGGSYSTVLSSRRVPMIRPDLRDRPYGRLPGPQITRPQP